MRLGKRVRQVIFVGGTSGSGKTTLVDRLADQGTSYRERGEDNEFLMRYVAGGQLDARGNQDWFFDQIESFLEQVDCEIAVVDQHPLAIGFAYAEYFREIGLLTHSDTSAVQSRADAIYSSLHSAGIRTLTVHLSAASETIWRRLKERPSPPKLPRSAIFRVNELMQGLIFEVPCLPINSEVLPPEEERQAVLSWLRRTLR